MDVRALRKGNVLGERMALIRRRAGLSQKELSLRLRQLGVELTPGALSRWENGDALPNAYQLLAWCGVFGIDDIAGMLFGTTASGPGSEGAGGVAIDARDGGGSDLQGDGGGVDINARRSNLNDVGNGRRLNGAGLDVYGRRLNGGGLDVDGRGADANGNGSDLQSDGAALRLNGAGSNVDGGRLNGGGGDLNLQGNDNGLHLNGAGGDSRLNARGEELLAEIRRALIESGRYTPEAEARAQGDAGTILLRVYNQSAAAGTGDFLDDEGFVSLEFERGLVPAGTDFGVRISGDSMEPEYADRSIAMVHRCGELDTGDIGIFVYNGDAFIKQYVEVAPDDAETGEYTDSTGVVHNKVILRSLNTAYRDIVVSPDGVLDIIGRVLNQAAG